MEQRAAPPCHPLSGRDLLCVDRSCAGRDPDLVVSQPSLKSTIARQIDADRHGLAQAQQSLRPLTTQLRAAQSKLAAATDPFAYDDAVGKLQIAAAPTAARIAVLDAAIRRLRAALQPVRLPTPLNTASIQQILQVPARAKCHFSGNATRLAVSPCTSRPRAATPAQLRRTGAND